MKNARKELIEQLNGLREQKGWSHSELARQLQIKQEAWAAIRTGTRALPLATATKVGDMFPALQWTAHSYVIEQVRDQKERRKARKVA